MITGCLLVFSADITFANSLDPDNAGQSVRLDLDPKLFDTDLIPEFRKNFSKIS